MTGLEGKAALVTGGATGIGRATVEVLLERGASVVLTGHLEDQLAAANAALGARHPALRTALADVRDQEALDRAAALAEAAFGRLDILVCAAGIQIPGTALTATERDWQAVLDVNLSGAFRASKAALPALQRSQAGAIVLVSSIQAVRGKRNGLAYVAAKGALNAMTRAMALDHAGDNIRVNAVCPGVVDTPLLRAAAATAGAADPGAVEALVRDWSQGQPLTPGIGRVCTARDVAKLIAFLASDEAAYVTGSAYGIDGGLAAKIAL
ncbi:MAG: SDR family NAD(P)-dependent oxidoreductase [Sneathiellaceae bacterium]